MALTTRNEIRAILESDWLDQLRESNYPKDLFAEIAEGLCPVYNGDIVDEWRDLSLDESDTWQEFGRDDKATILDLMRADLFWHYHNEVAQIWADLEAGNVCSIGGDNHSNDFVTVYEGNEEPAVFCGYHALVRDRFAPALVRPAD